MHDVIYTNERKKRTVTLFVGRYIVARRAASSKLLQSYSDMSLGMSLYLLLSNSLTEEDRKSSQHD